MRIQLTPGARDVAYRNGPLLTDLCFAVSLSGGGETVSYSSAQLGGYQPACLKVGGAVSPLYSYADITGGGASISVPTGKYSVEVSGFKSLVPCSQTSIPALIGQGTELYSIASGTLDTAKLTTLTLTPQYNAPSATELTSTCPGPSTLAVPLVLFYTGVSGANGASNLTYSSVEGGIPPVAAIGTMTAQALNTVYDQHVYNAGPLQSWHPRMDLFFAMPGQLGADFSYFRAVVSGGSNRPIYTSNCALTNIITTLADFELQLYRNPSHSWVGNVVSLASDSKQVDTNTLTLNDFYLAYRSEDRVLRYAVQLSIRANTYSEDQQFCSGIHLTSVKGELVR